MLWKERSQLWNAQRCFFGVVGEDMAGIYRGRRMGGQLVFFNVTVRATLPFNYSLLSHSSSSSTTVRILLPIIFMVVEWQRKD